MYCVITQYGIYGESENMYESLLNVYAQLLSGEFEDRQLQDDFRTYGVECFRFDPAEWGDKFKDPAFRKKTLEEWNREV